MQTQNFTPLELCIIAEALAVRHMELKNYEEEKCLDNTRSTQIFKLLVKVNHMIGHS